MNVLSRFNRISVVGYVGNIERGDRMCLEMSRIGAVDFDIEWNIPSPFDAYLHKAINAETSFRYFNGTMGHYRVIKRALLLGVSSLLVMEDDCRFLNDTSEILRRVNALPNDFDLALLDSIKPCGHPDSDFDWMNGVGRVNEYWSRGGVKRVSSACYALSKRGMEHLVQMYESTVGHPSDESVRLRASDQYFDPVFWHEHKFYVAIPNIAIQCEIPQSLSGYGGIGGSYEKEGIRITDYEAY